MNTRFAEQREYSDTRFAEQRENSDTRFAEQRENSDTRHKELREDMNKRFGFLQWIITGGLLLATLLIGLFQFFLMTLSTNL